MALARCVDCLPIKTLFLKSIVPVKKKKKVFLRVVSGAGLVIISV